MRVPSILQGLPDDLLTSFVVEQRRLKTEQGDTAYDEGRKFRAFYDFTGVTMPVVLKFVIDKPINLMLSTQEVHDGALRYRVFTGGVEGGTFSTTIPSLRINNKAGVPIIDSGVTLTTGGTLDVTGQAVNDIVYVRTAGASGQTSTVADTTLSDRGFPPATAYVVVDQIPGGNKSPEGVLKYEWSVD